MPADPISGIKQHSRDFSSRAELGECYLLLVDHTLAKYSISSPMPQSGDGVFEAFRLETARRDVSITLVEGPCFMVSVQRDVHQEFPGYSEVWSCFTMQST
jgi:hypothetical protein